MVVQLFKNIHMRTTEFVQLLQKTVHFGTNTIVNEIKNQGQCTKNVQLFSLVIHPFNGSTAFQKYTNEDHRICTAFGKNYIFVQTPLSMKLRAKDSVPKMYSFFLWLYSFLMVVQLS